MNKPRKLIDGCKLICPKCRATKHLDDFQNDKYNRFGKASRCRECVAKYSNKCEAVKLEFHQVKLQELRAIKLKARKTSPGQWQKVVDSLDYLPPGMAVLIRIEDDYYSHTSAHTSLSLWLKKKGLNGKFQVLHGENCVYLKRRSTKYA